jgi:hypothetical protein
VTLFITVLFSKSCITHVVCGDVFLDLLGDFACMYILKVRKIRNYFFKPTFLPKNERTNSILLLVDLFSFFFWKKVKTPKRHFEIN